MMFLRTLPIGLFCYALLALSVGRWSHPAFVIYCVGLWASAGLIYTLAPAELVKERLRPPSDRDRRSRLLSLPLAVSHYVLAGLDARLGWSRVPLPAQLVGFALVAVAMALVGWVLLTNPFASTAVRIQDDRAHQVITTGPYALVRHPMYLGVLAFTLGSGLALGSWWAGLALLPLLAVFARRTLFEDRMLHDELAGYREYAAKVRWRVVPGVF